MPRINPVVSHQTCFVMRRQYSVLSFAQPVLQAKMYPMTTLAIMNDASNHLLVNDANFALLTPMNASVNVCFWHCVKIIGEIRRMVRNRPDPRDHAVPQGTCVWSIITFRYLARVVFEPTYSIRQQGDTNGPAQGLAFQIGENYLAQPASGANTAGWGAFHAATAQGAAVRYMKQTLRCFPQQTWSFLPVS